VSESILCSVENNICTLKINRPNLRNAINRDVLFTLKKYLNEFYFDNQIRVLVITGEGNKAFCAGADLKERITFSEEEVKEFINNIKETFSLVANFPKPVISAINGIALGGGTELALACDIRIASDNASMGLTETKLGIIPGAGGTQRLSRIIGIARAKELIFTGKIINAKEAFDIGLLNKVTTFENLMEETYSLAKIISENAPIAIQQAKKAINKGFETDIETGLAFETEAYQTCIYTQDRIEGLNAFKEKRKAIYKGI